MGGFHPGGLSAGNARAFRMSLRIGHGFHRLRGFRVPLLDSDPVAPAATRGVDEIPTPALVTDGGVVRRNISRLAAYCRTHDLALRPHTKTHKSVFIAGLQLDAGAAGLTVAKAGEAEALLPAFAGRGAPDILVAYPPVDPARSARIAALAREATVRVALDTPFAAKGLAAAARAAGSTVGVLVDLDVGMGRTGVADPAARC